MNTDSFSFNDYITEKPFRECKSCGTSLEHIPYVVEKALRQQGGLERPTVVFEVALCMNCTEDMRQSMSASSLQNVQQYFQQNAAMEQMQSHSPEGLNTCAVSGKEVSQLEEVQLYAYFMPGMEVPAVSYALSGEIIEQVVELLSEETKDEIDDFMEQNFGLPPEYKSRLVGRKLILV